jgi:hypothetical protein
LEGEWHEFSLPNQMEQKQAKEIVPDQQTGKAIYAESSVEMNDEMSAMIFFEEVKKRLGNVNQWDKLVIGLMAKFKIVNNKGKTVERTIRKGDYLKIDIPGPGTHAGEGFDWVIVEELESMSSQEEEFFAFRVRPTENPLNENPDVAHFYSPDSTSTFTVTRKGNRITAGIYDRNTKPNEDAYIALDKIRDAVVAVAGLVAVSKIQWKKLTEGLLK